MPNSAALFVDRVHKRYGSGQNAVDALSDVSLRVEPEEYVAIMGPSGCGKSTLLNLIAGIDTPTSGRVWVAGQDLAQMSDDARSDLRLRHIGFVFQSFNLFPTFTAEENVTWPLEFLGVHWREARKRADAALAEVGLPDNARQRRPAGLSGGEQQRVAIARALVTKPRLLVADEPTGNLDSRTGQSILDLIQFLNREEHLSIVLVTHSPAAAACGHRLLELSDGRILRESYPRAAAAGG
ncbi:MAG: ABC transporter ATP-binding protein [Deltaproteobacteria bacterium]|nr:ABC transporter ATP-binding protein [Deltaproteobacteria bacterium]